MATKQTKVKEQAEQLMSQIGEAAHQKDNASVVVALSVFLGRTIGANSSTRKSLEEGLALVDKLMRHEADALFTSRAAAAQQ